MEAERRAGNQDLLVELLQRVAKIEARGEARDAWQTSTASEIKAVRDEIKLVSSALGTLVAEINAAKAVGRAGAGLGGWLLNKALPWGAAGTVGWLAALWSKH